MRHPLMFSTFFILALLLGIGWSGNPNKSAAQTEDEDIFVLTEWEQIEGDSSETGSSEDIVQSGGVIVALYNVPCVKTRRNGRAICDVKMVCTDEE